MKKLKKSTGLTAEQFEYELNRYIGGPEHNAYYDLMDIFNIINKELTPQKRRTLLDKINEVMESK